MNGGWAKADSNTTRRGEKERNTEMAFYDGGVSIHDSLVRSYNTFQFLYLFIQRLRIKNSTYFPRLNND